MNDLDKFGKPVNSPAYRAKNAAFQGGMEFDSQTDRGIIRTAKIRDASITNAKIGTAAIGTANIGTLTFNEIAGGTAVLGGAANGNGVLLVKDSGGTTKVTVDNAGVTITDGKLTFINSAGGTVLDGSGVNSVTTFPSSSVNPAAGTQSSTSYQPMVGGTMTTMVLTRTTKVFCYIDIFGLNPDGVNSSSYDIVDSFDSSSFFGLTVRGMYDTVVGTGAGGTVTNVDYFTYSTEVYAGNIFSLAAGTHTLSMKVRANTGGSAVWSFAEGGYFQLGA